MYKRKINRKTKKAQTATEYIIIVAVVIVIALVVVQIMGGFPGIGSGTSKKVSDYKLASTGEVGIDKYYFGNSSVLASIKNNNFQTLTVYNFTIAGNNGDGVLCNSTNTDSKLPVTLNPGQSFVITCNNSNFNSAQNNGATPSALIPFIYTDGGASSSSSYSGSGSTNIPIIIYNCTGTIPGNATLCSGDNDSLVANTAISVINNASVCNSSIKCEYYCNSNYYVNGGSCAAVLENCSTPTDEDGDGQGQCGDSDCSSTEYCVVNALRSGLIGYYPLNSNANDYSGNNRNGVNNGGTTTTAVVNGGFAFTYISYNNGQYIQLPNNNVYSSGGFSYGFWIKSSAADGRPTDETNGGGAQGLIIQCSTSGKLGPYLVSSAGSGAPHYYSTISNVCNNAWHYVTVVVDLSIKNMTTYIDGNLDKSMYFSNMGTVSPGTPVRIGRTSGGTCPDPGCFYTGSLDEFAIWNRTLNASEVTSLHNLTHGRSLLQ